MKQYKPNNTRSFLVALKTVSPFVMFSTMWITASDFIVETWSSTMPYHEVLHTGKGLVYVLIAAIIIFAVVRRLVEYNEQLDREKIEEMEKYRTIVSNITDVIWEVDDQCQYTFVSESCRNLYGFEPEEMLGQRVCFFTEDSMYFSRQICYNKGGLHCTEASVRRKDGTLATIEICAKPIIVNGEVVGYRGTDRDVTERKNLEDSLRHTILEQKVLLDNSLVGIAFLKDRKIVRVNDKFARLFHAQKSDLIGKHCHDLFQDRERMGDKCRECFVEMSEDHVHTEDTMLIRTDGSTFWGHISAKALDRGDPVSGTVVIVQDVTDRKRAEKEITRLAYYDSLTDLPNRLLMKDRLQTAIQHADRFHDKVALLFIDLDNFKQINDAFGHTVGDRVLVKTADRLQDSLRTTDTVARLGGDEFVVIMDSNASPANVSLVCNKIQDAFNKPFHVDGVELFMTPSIGVALYPNDATTMDELIKNADIAMYQAKEDGRGVCRFYSPDMENQNEARIRLETDLRYAIDRDELFLEYQPWLDLKARKIGGAEALVRWNHPERGIIRPDVFIPVAEETGLIIQIGEQVLSKACRDAKILNEFGYGKMIVSVNISPRQFKHEEIFKTVRDSIHNAGLSPSDVELEITETCVMTNTEESLKIIEDFVRYGVKISIDDFGTGYSSLAYLKHFPVDRLKIDKSFVDGVMDDEHDSSIVKVIIALAKTMDLRVIGEGVETADQLHFLYEHGADEAQGYYIAKPMLFEDLIDFVDRFEPRKFLPHIE